MVPTGPQHHQPSCPPMLSARVRTSGAPRLADLPDRLADLPLVSGARDLRGHDDADELAAIARGGEGPEPYRRLGGRDDLEDLGPADGAGPLGRGAAVLHGDLRRVLYLARGLALDAIPAGQRSPSRWSVVAAYPSPLARPLDPIPPQNPDLSAGVRGEEGKGWDFLLSNPTNSKPRA